MRSSIVRMSYTGRLGSTAFTAVRAAAPSADGSPSALITSVKPPTAVCANGRYISIGASRLSEMWRTLSMTPTMRNHTPES
jgi:hypothetical protein